MIVYSLVFYFFSFIAIFAAVNVIRSANPVHSVLWLILSFFSVAGLFILLGAEFLAMVLIIVYVGAISVLFLFVVMMLNINYEKIKSGYHKLIPLCLLISIVIIYDFYLIFTRSIKGGNIFPSSPNFDLLKQEHANKVSNNLIDTKYPFPNVDGLTNSEAIGVLLYTDYFIAFQISGLILLVAMIASIVLTQRNSRGALKQNVVKQVSRDRKKSLKILKVKSRKGIDV